MTGCEIKFCKDCRHSAGLRNFFPTSFVVQSPPRCHRPILTEAINLATGEPKRINADAVAERRPGKTLFGRERCGPAAKFFEQYTPPPPPKCLPPRPTR